MEPFFAGEYIIYPLCKDKITTYYKLKYTTFVKKDREYWARTPGQFHFRGNCVDRVWREPTSGSTYVMSSSAGLSEVPITIIKLRSIQHGRFFYGCDSNPEDIIVFSEKLKNGTEILKVEPSKVFTKDEKEGIVFRGFSHRS